MNILYYNKVFLPKRCLNICKPHFNSQGSFQLLKMNLHFKLMRCNMGLKVTSEITSAHDSAQLKADSFPKDSCKPSSQGRFQDLPELFPFFFLLLCVYINSIGCIINFKLYNFMISAQSEIYRECWLFICKGLAYSNSIPLQFSGMCLKQSKLRIRD